MTITITRTDLDATGLRVAATRSRDIAAARRMLALALVHTTPKTGPKGGRPPEMILRICFLQN